ncbi:MAG: shikimate kinase [Candidatus Ventricola sp.]
MGNIVLIGMPGCGKSTVGVLLAKALGMAFVDTDVVFQAKEGRKLQQIIEEIGIDAFLAREEEAILSLCCDKTVIATGGSVVYGQRAMKHLHERGVVVYIRLPYQEIERRLSNLATRGVTLRKGQTLSDLYDERIPLYEKEADVVLDASDLEIEQTVEALARRMERMNGAVYGG